MILLKTLQSIWQITISKHSKYETMGDGDYDNVLGGNSYEGVQNFVWPRDYLKLVGQLIHLILDSQL